MSVDMTYGQPVCLNCGSDDTDCSINRGSDVDIHTNERYWDEGWKCRNCGGRFEVARAFESEDYIYHLEANDADPFIIKFLNYMENYNLNVNVEDERRRCAELAYSVWTSTNSLGEWKDKMLRAMDHDVHFKPENALEQLAQMFWRRAHAYIYTVIPGIWEPS